MKHLVSASILAAASIIATTQAEAATRVYTGDCQVQCSFQKVVGTVNSVRIEYTTNGGYFLVASPSPEYEGAVTTYLASTFVSVLGGNSFSYSSTGTFEGFLATVGVSIPIDQMITSGLDYYQGEGTFTAGAGTDTSFTTISGRPIEQVYGIGSPGATPIRITIDYDAVPGVPEPSTWALMLAGFGMVGYAMRRKKARVAIA